MISPKARSALEVLSLAATGLCLLGHGFNGSAPSCDSREGQAATYNVTGTCGPAGVITVKQPGQSCQLDVTGDDVGLPNSGSNQWVDTSDGFWLSGSPTSDWYVHCSADPAGRTDAGATVPGQMILSCRAHASLSGSQPQDPVNQDWCRGDLVPVTETCDLRACPKPSCTRGQHAILSQPSCCAVCVDDTPADVVPPPMPEACHPEKCSTTCPAGEETNIDGGVCCGWCQPVPQTCLDGRALWRSEVATRWKTVRACNVDEDCTLTVAAGACGNTCLDAIAVAQIASFSAWAASRSPELCPTCFGHAAPPDCADEQIRGAVCIGGTCQTKK